MAKTFEKFLTPEFRVTFPQVFEPKDYNGKKKYTCGMLISKKADIGAFRNAITKVLQETWPDVSKRPKKLINPIKDGDTDVMEDGMLRCEKYPEIKGHYLISASSLQRPGVLDKDKTPMLDPQAFYSGCHALATLTCFAYGPSAKNPQSKHGIGFGLQNILKTRDDEPFSGRAKAEDDFRAVNVQAPVEDTGSFDAFMNG